MIGDRAILVAILMALLAAPAAAQPAQIFRARFRCCQRTRYRLRGIPTRQLHRGLPGSDAAGRAEQRSQGHDALGRALCQRIGRRQRRSKGRGMVQACRRARRPRGDVCAGHVQDVRPRRPGRPSAGGAPLGRIAPSLGNVVATYDLGLLYLQGEIVSRMSSAPRNSCAGPLTPAARKRNTRWPRFYKEGRGVEKDPEEAARLLGLAARAGQPSPRSNTASPCSTARASPGTKPPPPAFSSRRHKRTTRLPRTGWRGCTRPGAASKPTRSRPDAGT